MVIIRFQEGLALLELGAHFEIPLLKLLLIIIRELLNLKLNGSNKMPTINSETTTPNW